MLLASQPTADGYLTLAASQAVSLNTTQLGISLVLSLAVLIFLVTVVKLHPFVSLLGAALVVGIGSGYGPVATLTSFTGEFGSTMGSVGILIGLGAMIGKVLMTPEPPTRWSTPWWPSPSPPPSPGSWP